MSPREKEEGSMVLSYMGLRQMIGLLAATLPFILYFGGKFIFDVPLQRSLSYYYHTGMGDVLVGVMCAVAFFMFAYKGYNRKDNWLGHLCCLFSLGIALAPAEPYPLLEKGLPSVVNCYGIAEVLKKQICPMIAEVPTSYDVLMGKVHLISSGLLFFSLIYFSLFLFTKSNKPKTEWSNRKKQRNKIYIACGVIMILCMIIICIQDYVPGGIADFLKDKKAFFWMESTAIIAFGFSWLTKGQAILKDEV